MNEIFYYFFFCYLSIQVLSVVPEWDLSKAGDDILGGETKKSIVIDHRIIDGMEMIMRKNITKTDTSITIINSLKIAEEEDKEVLFDQVESIYNLFDTYIVCPKGKYHPYDFKGGQPIIPKDFSGENWDLKCYKNNAGKNGFFLVFYLMNGNNKNVYLTNCLEKNWYSGASIEPDNTKEIYDFLLKNVTDGLGGYQMLAFLNEDNNINLVYLAYELKEGRQWVKSHARKTVIEKLTYSQAYYKNSTENDKYFYYFTYNDITDFKTGYSTSAINEKENYYFYISQDKIHITNNDYPYFEFFDDVKIEKMEFLLNNKFLYYIMESLNNEQKYYGIFDIKLNKIIFNIKEEITRFLPYNYMALLIETKDKVYKVCAYKDKDNNCVDTCTDGYLLDLEGNKCGSECPSGKFVFEPLKVCTNKCNEDYYVISGNKCGLCKDINESHPYKLINGTECLDGIIDNSYVYNAKLKLLKCENGYHRENNTCVEDILCYELCKECSESSSNETDQKCTSCINGFERDKNNNCICPSGKRREDKNCIICENKCEKYIVNKCECESCPDHHFLKNSMCEECDSNCLTCETESTKCTDCKKDSFLSDNKCYNCTDCKQKEADSCKCQSCIDGSYLDNYQCKICENDCKTCSSSTNCSSCEQFYYLENEQCKKCSIDSLCISTEKNSCKCTACAQHYFLYDENCKECNNETRCNSYVDDEKCKCKTCNEGFYNDNHYCEKCSDKCETCNGGKVNDLNHNCLSCKKDSEDKYLLNKDDKHICVNDCSIYNGTNNLEKNICEFQENNDKKEGGVDVALIIVVCVVGVLLIIISACICKKFICQKNETEAIEDIEEGELIDK